jgi:hypothetical protein
MCGLQLLDNVDRPVGPEVVDGYDFYVVAESLVEYRKHTFPDVRLYPVDGHSDGDFILVVFHILYSCHKLGAKLDIFFQTAKYIMNYFIKKEKKALYLGYVKKYV